MTFNIVGVRTADDVQHGNALYPLVGVLDSDYLVELEDADGPHPQRIHATGLTVSDAAPSGPRHTLLSLADVDIDVYVTASRVVLACPKFTKGGGWSGFGVAGLLVAGAANAVSHARAAHQRRGKLLVGHVRYPWLATIGVTSRRGFGTRNGIRLAITEKAGATQRAVILDLTLDKHTDAPLVAQHIARDCAAYRLTHDVGTDHPDYRTVRGLASCDRLYPQSRDYETYTIPSARPASPATAHLPAMPTGSKTPPAPAAAAATACRQPDCSRYGTRVSTRFCVACGNPTT